MSRANTSYLALIGALFLGAVLVGCVTVDEGRDDFVERDDVGPLLKKQITKRIDSLKYQRGLALLDSLSWLILYGESAVPQLVEALEDPDPRTRSYAAYVLGEIGNRDTVPGIRDALTGEKNKLVRYEMAASLITLGDWAQLGVMIDGLDEASKSYRVKCFTVLKKNLNLSMGYDPHAVEEERGKAVAKWRVWWDRKKGSFSAVVKKD